MRITLLTSLFIILSIFTRGQESLNTAFDKFDCLFSTMVQGLNNGHWDTTRFYENKTDCKDYFNNRILEIRNDTLIITKRENNIQSSDDFVGIKAVILSDSLIKAAIYLEDKLNGKAARRLNRKNKTDKTLPLFLKIEKQGDSSKVSFY
jgi:hypothetical protein